MSVIEKQEYNILKEQFITNTIAQINTMKVGDYKLGNKYARNLIKIFKRISNNREIQERFLLDLMNCDNMDVKVHAATEAIRQNILKELSITTLKNISMMQDSECKFAAFHSKQFLEKILPTL